MYYIVEFHIGFIVLRLIRYFDRQCWGYAPFFDMMYYKFSYGIKYYTINSIIRKFGLENEPDYSRLLNKKCKSLKHSCLKNKQVPYTYITFKNKYNND